MNANRKRRVALLSVMQALPSKHKSDISEVIRLYSEHEIPNYKTAKNIISNLTSGRKSVNQKGLTTLSGFRTEKEYFVKGTARIRTTYAKHRKGVKTSYEKEYETVVKESHKIMATSRAMAKRKFEEQVKSRHLGGNGFDSDHWKNETVEDVFINDITETKEHEPRRELDTRLRSVGPVRYGFICSDESHLRNNGHCVVDQIDKLYGHLNSELSRLNFIRQCNELENGIDDNGWDISQGVTVSTLNEILRSHDISFHSFDILGQRFDKNISRSYNYPSLVYYAVNNHMYCVTDHAAAQSLIQKARDFETKVNSEMVVKFEAKNTYVDTQQKVKSVFENVPVRDISDEVYKNGIIFYTELTDLEDVLIDIIRHHNYIPAKIKHNKMLIVRIIFEKDGQNVILSVDVNNSIHRELSYKDIIKLCELHKLEFKNQTIGSLVGEIRSAFFSTTHKRIKFTKEKREELHRLSDMKCRDCERQLTLKQTHIDHVKPLAAGGSNEDSNLQILCRECHFDKSQQEMLNHEYVMVSKTTSSYNSRTFEIITSSSSGVFPFIETLSAFPPNRGSVLFAIDLIKSRKNAIYHSHFDFPLFTVMDQPLVFKRGMSHNKPGIFFVECDLYFPVRGNGWYSHAMTSYLLKKKLIRHHQIRYVVYSSLRVPADYFNKLIDATYALNDGYEKFKINCMIGLFKPSKSDRFKTLAISTDPNVIYHHYLQTKACFVDKFAVDDVTYYHLLGKYESKVEESETPLYNMTLELENINLYEMCEEIQRLGGTVLDVNTDCAVCTFKDNKMPFDVGDDNVIRGYHYDTEGAVPKYRLVPDAQRLQVGHLPKWKRTDNYALKELTWSTVPDVEDNDFQPLVERMLESDKGFNIDGRAGTGKSYLIKALHAEMNKRGLRYASLAPTNKAARIIQGRTIHKFIAGFSVKRFKEKGYSFIFVDEISMVQEVFYKFFVYIRRVLPSVKFVIAGDFSQLLPVKDRLPNCNYQKSIALHELCDGQQLLLTKCRRSDSTLFNLLKPENVGSLKRELFGSLFTDRHLTLTNRRRMAINDIMMNREVARKKKKPLTLEKLAYDKNSQTVQLLPGTPVISRVNNKTRDISNNELFVVKRITPDTITIKDEERSIDIPVTDFQRAFYVAYAITICKSQGSTFAHAYTIHEWSRLDARNKYVALSRAASLDLINVAPHIADSAPSRTCLLKPTYSDHLPPAH